jgi:hypothetical protein
VRAPDAKPVLKLEACAGIPRNLRSDPSVAGLAYPMFLSVARARCVDFAVTSRGGATVHRTISLGAGRCRPSPAASHETAAESTLRLGCESSWTPNEQTFRDPHWRTNSLRIGALRLLGARRAASLRIERHGLIKFPTLARPRTPVTISIGRGARRDVAFVRDPPPAGGRELSGFSSLALAGCPAVPRLVRVYRDVPDVGFPMFLQVKRDRCVDFAVTPRNARTIHRTISLGAGRCRAA